jgi:hypothetical protein
LLVEEGERAALYFQRKDFEIVRKIKFAPTPNKPRRLDTLSNVLGDVRVGSDSDLSASQRHFCFTPKPDIDRGGWHVRKVSQADSCTAASNIFIRSPRQR